MRIGARDIAFTSLLSSARAFAKCLPRLSLVKDPLAVLRAYLRCESPPYVELSSGHRISLSSHPHDIITFFVVFLRRDYGDINEGDVVADIGANIGMFALYAALHGAARVYAFEPSQEAFRVLCKNVESNGLAKVIIPINKAVSDTNGHLVKFPSASSPYNRLGLAVSSDAGACCEVRTITLDAFIAEHGIAAIDLLKMDCEGAEFSIVPSLTEFAISRINKIRLECHGSPRQLVGSFCRNAYMVERMHGDNLWLTRRSS